MESAIVVPLSERYKTYVQHCTKNYIFHKNILCAEERWIYIAKKLKGFRVF